VREHARDETLGSAVGLARARDLDGKTVLLAGTQQLGDLERMREEVALGLAEVAGVEPDVAVVEDAVQDQERTAAALETGARELSAVEDRAVGLRELGCRAPVTGDRQRSPLAIVEPALDEPLMQITLASMGAPRPREVERARIGAQLLFFAVLARPAVGFGLVSSTAGGDGGGAPPVLRPGAVPRWRSSSFWMARCSQLFTQSLALKKTLAPCNATPRPQNTVAHRRSQPTAARKMMLRSTKKKRWT